ncbi:MAG: hypothetical protein JOZ69_03905 [Myxococcales bacterium]|nr:hypothetical protein [Myxococcales bacterium]
MLTTGVWTLVNGVNVLKGVDLTVALAPFYVQGFGAGVGVTVSGVSVAFSLNVLGATNASPIVVTVGSTLGLQAGMMVQIAGVQGNLAANGIWPISNVTGTTFQLVGSVGSGAWVGGGTVTIVPLPDPVNRAWSGATLGAAVAPSTPATITLNGSDGRNYSLSGGFFDVGIRPGIAATLADLTLVSAPPGYVPPPGWPTPPG